MLMTGAREEILELEEPLERISCIYYSVQFKKNMSKAQVQALVNSRSEVNAIYPAFAK